MRALIMDTDVTTILSPPRLGRARPLADTFVRLRSAAAAALLFVSLSPGIAASQDPFKGLELIRPSRAQAALPFTIPTPDGKSLKLVDYKGKVVFLSFWATWCPPCKDELPAMERLFQRTRKEGLVMLAVSVDADPKVVASFLKEQRFTFTVGLDPTMELANAYGVRGLPASFIVDREGHLAALAIGPRAWDSAASQALVEGMSR